MSFTCDFLNILFRKMNWRMLRHYLVSTPKKLIVICKMHLKNSSATASKQSYENTIIQYFTLR